AGPRRCQAARGVGSLGRVDGAAAGGPRCRSFGAPNGSLSAARRGPARRPLGVALRTIPRDRDLADMAAWAVLRVTSCPRAAGSTGRQPSGRRGIYDTERSGLGAALTGGARFRRQSIACPLGTARRTGFFYFSRLPRPRR